MIVYMVQRFLMLIPTLLGISLVTFLLIHVVPGDPARTLLGLRGGEEAVQQIRKAWGLNDPLYLQYGRFLMRLVRGDLGRSYASNQDVLEAILKRFPATFKLGVTAILITAGVGIFLGIFSAVYNDRFVDRLIAIFTLSGASIPVFFLGLVLAWVLGFLFNLTPLSGYASGMAGLKYLILPSLTLSLYPTAVVTRLTRTSLLEVLQQDYIRTSLAYGLPNIQIVYKYALKNALIPVITALGNSTALILSGSFFVEYIFNWPGIGLLAVDAISRYDFPVIQGTVLFAAVVFVLVTMLVDVSYRLLDPRIRVT